MTKYGWKENLKMVNCGMEKSKTMTPMESFKKCVFSKLDAIIPMDSYKIPKDFLILHPNKTL
jgi:hypothetical protein